MTVENINISGKKIILRNWQLSDLESYAHWQMSGHEWQDFNGPYFPRIKDENIPDMIQKLREKIETNQWDAVPKQIPIASAVDNRLIGRMNWYWTVKETNWLSVGLVIFDPASWGHGIGYEALGLWCEYLWQAMPILVRLGLGTWSGNVRMMRLAEKLGFKQEARARKALIVKGAYFDSMGYGILREEWRNLYPNGFGK